MNTNTAPMATCPMATCVTRRALPTLVAGIAGLLAWETFARLVAPLWLGFALEPTALIDMAFGITDGAAQALHLLTGLVAFPLGYTVLAARLTPAVAWPVLGAGYGVALWVFAMYGVASVIGGAPAFMGFAPVAWASLAGHVLLGLAIAAVMAAFVRNA